MKERYDISCHKLDCAVSEDTNAGFTHWCARGRTRQQALACRSSPVPSAGICCNGLLVGSDRLRLLACLPAVDLSTTCCRRE
jgi:hypothetical protein